MLVWEGHQTNFEWMATGLPLLIPQKVFAVFQPLRNACMGQKIVEIRERFGLKLFPMDETYPFMLNNPVKDAAYIFMADQSPQKKRIKYRTRFFGMDTPVHLGVENLSKKLDLSVVFIYAKRVSRGHYSLKARLLTDRPVELPDHQITDTHVRWLEEEIREEPAHIGCGRTDDGNTEPSKMDKDKVAVAILNYNGKHWLEKFLPKVLEHSGSHARVYVIDNASTDDSVDLLNRSFPEVRQILNTENEGYTGGYNAGMAQLDEEIVVLLNSDVEVSENWLQPIVDAFEGDEQLAAVPAQDPGP